MRFYLFSYIKYHDNTSVALAATICGHNDLLNDEIKLTPTIQQNNIPSFFIASTSVSILDIIVLLQNSIILC